MRKGKKFTWGVLLALFMLIIGSTTAMAASESNLSPNKWVTVNENDDVYYKITIKNDGYLTINAQNLEKGEYYYLYIRKKNKGGGYDYVSDVSWTADASSKAVRCALKKGTYYLDPSYDNFKFKYNFTKASYKSNYCPEKAIKLDANKEIVEIVTPAKYYDRWYKITLKKKSDITYWKTGSGYVRIYDSNFEAVDTVSDATDASKYYSRSKLKKGTYYICLEHYFPSNKSNAIGYMTIKWK